MGNCLLGANSDPDTLIKVITFDGNIMEFYPPITVNFITNEFQGHAIFPTNDQSSKPLCQFDELVAGQSYYLLPMTVLSPNNKIDYPSTCATAETGGGGQIIRQGHVRSQSVPTTPLPAPYRMSLDYQYYQGVGLLKRTSTESFSCRTNRSSVNKSTISSSRRSSRKSTGIWKVKLCITPEKLLEILSQEVSTKELIESVRIVAKCGVTAASSGGCGISSTTSIVSDQWSLSSSGRSAPSKVDALVLDI
ncbi:hypothetical protein MtrunA17_Chr6g0469901 [Medicago truncatula]|uniref:DUF4228 domain protein n=1 Tax=Medicago truncatula TaxID=3880 RepID=G7KLF9_MEDTR|nr:uncharacterized protein LOC11443657 [Medicago truncatula]AES75628.2 DUF4228 domain protein [Medicago truncatula]RHN51552.1 hypothetical protein MtrunA17_Chr6g0469901 [Medicago truncatula]